MKQEKGYFVISLDFELFWGMFDKHSIETYGERILGERSVVPRMLTLFREYGIHASWAAVGMAMARDRDELVSFMPPPERQPKYANPALSSYQHLERGGVGAGEHDDPYHFGPSIIRAILSTPFQDIENHTFSHYYCLEEGADNPECFAADLDAHARIAEKYEIKTYAIVFPRNQWTPSALAVCAQKGLRAFRGNEPHFLYRARTDGAQSFMIRGLRFLDHYLNISGYHTYPLPKTKEKQTLVNIPASRFFRPYLPQLSLLEPLRLHRITRAMTHAAKRGEVFHLWWHPHNFGVHQEENLKNLMTILEHFKHLRSYYGMESASMREILRLADERAR